MMLDRSLTPLFMALAVCLPTSGRAQDSIPWPRGDRLSVSVGARLLETVGDSVGIEYTVTNAPNSEQAVRAFVVRTFLAQYRLRSPTLWWGSIGVRQDSSAASWSAESRSKLIPPGGNLGGFQFAALGLPEPVAYRVAGYYEIPEADEGTLVQTPPSFWVNSVPGFTVGIVPFPPDSTPRFLFGRVRKLTDRACDLGWLTPTQCGTLWGRLDRAQQALGQGDIAGARGHVEAFRNDVSTFTGDAFALLKPNADYALRVWSSARSR